MTEALNHTLGCLFKELCLPTHNMKITFFCSLKNNALRVDVIWSPGQES